MASFGNVMGLYNKCQTLPFGIGKRIFSLSFGIFAPYFLSIRPSVEDLAPGRAVVSMKQRWAVQNHIKTVHAIAVCNLVEMAMGLVAESSIPSHLRWLPMGMNVDYKKKATGKLTAETNIDHNTFFNLEKYPGPVHVPVVVKNEIGDIVTEAQVKLWISKKPEKK